MKALQLQALNQLKLVDMPVPEIGKDELLIRTGATTICTSDINDIRENPFGMVMPSVMGHEGAGMVVVVGEAVVGFKDGDRVATHPVHPCGNCPPCQDGFGHLCLNMGHFGYNLPGTFAEYYRVRQDRARKIDDIPYQVAALSEPVCVCLEALAQARLAPGANLLILGDGPFGVLMSRLAARLDLGQVVIAGWSDFRLAFSRQAVQVNTYQVVEPTRRLRAVVDSYDAAILAVGSHQAFADGLRCLQPRGRMVVFSAIPGETPVDLFSVHLKELEILGACSDQDLFDEAVSLLSDPQLALAELVTHQFSLDAYKQAFHLAEHGKDHALKVAFTFPDVKDVE
jgi:threonine dehydrogenase-like Zn-dependent dehydrogenase